MGGPTFWKKSSSSRLEHNSLRTTDPVPTNFEIISTESGNGFVLAEISYPNCTNFEGRKLLLFSGVTSKWVRSQSSIDPHFTESGRIVARFEPTASGRELARRLLT